MGRGGNVSWVTQASFEPRLVAVGMRKGTAICEAVKANKRFAIQVVAADQTRISPRHSSRIIDGWTGW